MTFAEFEQVETEPGKDELLNGELFHLPPASHSHVLVARRLFARLLQAVDGGKPDRVYLEAGYKIGARNWLVPDVSVAHRDQVFGQYAEGSPEIAIDVISEFNPTDQIDLKRKLYLTNGGAEVWVV